MTLVQSEVSDKGRWWCRFLFPIICVRLLRLHSWNQRLRMQTGLVFVAASLALASSLSVNRGVLVVDRENCQRTGCLSSTCCKFTVKDVESVYVCLGNAFGCEWKESFVPISTRACLSKELGQREQKIKETNRKLRTLGPRKQAICSLPSRSWTSYQYTFQTNYHWKQANLSPWKTCQT